MKRNNIALQKGVRLEGKFVSKIVINLSKRNLSASEVSLLSKSLNFVPTANEISCELESSIGRIWKETTAYVAL